MQASTGGVAASSGGGSQHLRHLRQGRRSLPFATEESTHCPLWFSWTEESSTLGQDALAHDWPKGRLYAFPPIPLIRPTLQRVLQHGHRLLLVALFWPGRTWFPLLRKLCSSSPQRLPDRKDLLSQLQGQIWHPDPNCLQLCIWPLQGPNRCWQSGYCRRGLQYYIERQGAFYPGAVREQVAAVCCMVFRQG